jgi:hypothetical protein
MDETGVFMSDEEFSDCLPIDMNASLYRQIRAAEKKYEKFRELLENFYIEAYEHPDTVRRVR